MVWMHHQPLQLGRGSVTEEKYVRLLQAYRSLLPSSDEP